MFVNQLNSKAARVVVRAGDFLSAAQTQNITVRVALIT